MRYPHFPTFAILSLFLATNVSCSYAVESAKVKVNVALYAFKDVELLDFFGPFDVLMKANTVAKKTEFNYYTVGATKDAVTTGNGLVTLLPKYCVEDSPKPDIIIVAGAEPRYIKAEARNEKFLKNVVPWLAKHKDIKKMMSVCVGSLLLGKAGLLDGKTATTHHLFFGQLQQMIPKVKLVKGIRYTQDGNLLTTAGVTAGIDGTLHVLEEFEPGLGDEVAKILEYERIKLK